MAAKIKNLKGLIWMKLWKLIWFCLLLILPTNTLALADKTLAIYEIDEGLRQYKIQTGQKVYHLGKDNPFEVIGCRGQCTWFSYAVTKERIPCKNHAYKWYKACKDHPDWRIYNKPKVGSVCVWGTGYYPNYGHVGKVTKVYANGSFDVWDANYKSVKITHRRITNFSKITGFVIHKNHIALSRKFQVIDFRITKYLNNDVIAITLSDNIHQISAKKISRLIQLSTPMSFVPERFAVKVDRNKIFIYKTNGRLIPGGRYSIKLSRLIFNVNGSTLYGGDYTKSFVISTKDLERKTNKTIQNIYKGFGEFLKNNPPW